MNFYARVIVIYLTIVFTLGAATDFTWAAMRDDRIGVTNIVNINTGNNTTFTANMTGELNTSMPQEPQAVAGTAITTEGTSVGAFNIWNSFWGFIDLMKGIMAGMPIVLNSIQGVPFAVVLLFGWIPTVMFWIALVGFVRGL